METLSTIETRVGLGGFYDVSNNPELKQTIDESLMSAVAIMGIYEVISTRKGVEAAPLPIDVLSSTRDAFDALETHGPNSFSYIQAKEAQKNDALRLLDEVLSAKTFRLRDPIFQAFDYQNRDYSTNGVSHKNMVTNGLSPLCNEEEKRIRQIEYMEEDLSASVQEEFEELGLSLINIKECPDWAIEAHENGESNTGGYVPSVNKFVIQQFKYVEGGRIYQQASIPGELISHEDILEVLSDLASEQVEGDKLEIRSKYFASELDLEDLIIALDEKASGRLGKNIYLGEEVDYIQEKSYQDLSEISKIDESKKVELTAKLVDKLDEIYSSKINPMMASVHLDKFVSQLILENFYEDEKTIENTFGSSFALTAQQILNNRTSDIDALSELNKLAPQVEYCGAGSCGIDLMDQSNNAAVRGKSKGLKGEIGFFKDGSCKNCSAKGFVVGDNGKYCDKCGSVDLIK